MNQREIKFRAWDRKEKEMLIPALEILNIGLGDGSLAVDERAQRGNELDWMQFTGLKDKNGKEIYEGDICEMALTTPYGLIKHKGVMKFNEKSAQFGCDVETELENIADHIEQKEAPKVIGNIYENPELLK